MTDPEVPIDGPEPTATLSLYAAGSGEPIQEWDWDGEEEVVVSMGNNLKIGFGGAIP